MHIIALERLLPAFCLIGFLTACGGGNGSDTSKAPPVVQVVNGVHVVTLGSDDRMRYSATAFSVPAGVPVRLTLNNNGRKPKKTMAHNFVLLQPGTDTLTFATQAGAVPEEDYLPAALRADVLAHTALLGPGESDTITFTAPKESGAYDFVCTFPAHYVTGMKGVMTVTSAPDTNRVP